MSRVVFRIAKLKSAAAINGASKHNSRERVTEWGESVTMNAAPARTPDNVVIRSVPEGLSAHEAVMDVIGDQAIRKDAVLAVEAIISASPEFFRPDNPAAAGEYDPEALAKWRAAVEPWIAEKFPHAVSVVLHLDESTPHYHVIDVPLSENGRLSARNKFGGPRDLAKWQTSAAEAVKHLGIERGKESSEAHHLQVGQFYAAVTRRGGWQEVSAKAAHYDAAAQEVSTAKEAIAKLTAENEMSKAVADKLRGLDPRDVLTQLYGARVEYQGNERSMIRARLKDGRAVVSAADPQRGGFGWKLGENKMQRGAINLVMTLDGCDYRAAVARLAHAFGDRAAAAEHVSTIADRAANYVKESKEMHPAQTPQARSALSGPYER